jgi:hypothetical protein
MERRTPPDDKSSGYEVKCPLKWIWSTSADFLFHSRTVSTCGGQRIAPPPGFVHKTAQNGQLDNVDVDSATFPTFLSLGKVTGNIVQSVQLSIVENRRHNNAPCHGIVLISPCTPSANNPIPS